MTVPVRVAFTLDAVERRMALYVCGEPLRPSLRGNRARLADLIDLGVERLGLDRVRELAAAYRELLADSGTVGCPLTRSQVLAVWPDRQRAQVARVLARSSVWPEVSG